jgi:hypothetical protein
VIVEKGDEGQQDEVMGERWAMGEWAKVPAGRLGKWAMGDSPARAAV